VGHHCIGCSAFVVQARIHTAIQQPSHKLTLALQLGLRNGLLERLHDLGADLALVDLARGATWKWTWRKEHVLNVRHLEMRQMLPRKLEELALGRESIVRRSVVGLEQRHHGRNFAEPLIGQSEHGALVDRRMHVEHALDLGAANVLASSVDDLDAVNTFCFAQGVRQRKHTNRMIMSLARSVI